MLRKLSCLLLVSFVASACADDPIQPSLQDDGLAALGAGSPEAQQRHLIVFQNRAPASFEAQVKRLGGEVALNHSIGIAIVRGLTDEQASGLKSLQGVQYVEEAPRFEHIAPAALGEELESTEVSTVEIASPDNPTTALWYPDQWNMRLIQAPQAWAAGRLGSPAVRVAILDTGIDYTLPDLVGRVDLSRSASFEPIDDLYTAFYFPGRHPSTDLHYHGTNVAMQVASNGNFIAGVTSKTTLMSVKVCSVLGGCNGVTEGILFAIDNGADVINMSLGGWFRKSAFPGEIAAYNRILNYANQKGVTIVVSAGNDANDLDTQKNIAIRQGGVIVDRIHVPSFFSVFCDGTHVICVSSVRANDVPSSFTNYGRSAIDVAAPGGEGGAVANWVYALCPRTSLLFNCSNAAFVYRLGVAGTSQAAPHVSGLAALAVEDVGRNPARVRSYVRNSADAIGGGNTQFYGRGRINVARAVGAQ